MTPLRLTACLAAVRCLLSAFSLCLEYDQHRDTCLWCHQAYSGFGCILCHAAEICGMMGWLDNSNLLLCCFRTVRGVSSFSDTCCTDDALLWRPTSERLCEGSNLSCTVDLGHLMWEPLESYLSLELGMLQWRALAVQQALVRAAAVL